MNFKDMAKTLPNVKSRFRQFKRYINQGQTNQTKKK